MRVLTDEDVSKCVTVAEAIEVNEQAFRSLHAKRATVPPRLGIPFPEEKGITLFKPAHVQGTETANDETKSFPSGLGLKVVSVRPNNANIGLPTVPGTIMTFDEKTAAPAAVMAATYLTALRTAAGSAAATRALLKQRPPPGGDPTSLAVFGAGLQGELHILALKTILPRINTIHIINRSAPRIERLVAKLGSVPGFENVTFTQVLLADETNVAKTVGESNIVVCATNASEPILKGEWLASGTHVIGVGSYTPKMQEIDEAAVRRCYVILDTEAALASGDLAKAEIPESQHQTLGALLAEEPTAGGGSQAKSSEGVDCTFFKSVGTAVQDIATAAFVQQQADARNIGIEVAM